MHERVNIYNLGEGSPGNWIHTPFNLPLTPGFWWHLRGIFPSMCIKYVPHTLIGTPMHNITVWDY